MDVAIFGAGHVGRHAAEVLVLAGHRVTILDTDAVRLRHVQENVDTATLTGSCSDPRVLKDARINDADLVIAATASDEVNLLSASMAKNLGAKTCVARVHHRAFLDPETAQFTRTLGIDRLVCPEQVTSDAISRALRSPGAIAIESFSQGRIEIQEIPISEKSPAVGLALRDVRMPQRTRLVGISRAHEVILPKADTVLEKGDVIILVGDTEHFEPALELFGARGKGRRQNIVIMGGPPMAVWLCRSLHSRRYALRIFEADTERAEQIAEKLDWVTVVNGDPTDPGVFSDESVGKADAFVALTKDDESNILGSAWVKSQGVPLTIAVVQRPQYAHLLHHVGIDRAFSPRSLAVEEILMMIEEGGLRRVGSLVEGVLEVFRARVGRSSPVAGRPLKDISELQDWVVVGVEQGDRVFVPTANDAFHAGDIVQVVGKPHAEKKLASLLGTRVDSLSSAITAARTR